ncbi:MAG TPA: peptidoglycan DD-metalloendopeptidase family protein, partial [Geothrix sp.]|nr:peptidoglycan DD-metalloendopeptidase family protein [Geothrix sp.]
LWNHILPPYIIHAGDDLVILDHPADDTDETESAPPEPVAAARPGPKSPPPKSGKPATSPRPPVNATPARTASTVRWSWPTQGKVAARFSAGAGRKGVDLAGKLGQPVKAAADGDVVYSGSGLIGYGNLVIIKHDEVFLSAYAHNRKLLVKEGDKVKAGQPIGEMGQNAKAGSILHFEIRRHGKPVDPLLYLPNQPS